MIEQNPCKLCGACCIGYRASFYWAEADDATKGGVPVRMTIRVGLFRRAMRRDTDGRCIALHGAPGHRVSCTIYTRRPSVCRNFEPAWQGVSGDNRCNESRARLGLPPIDGSAKNFRQI
ncbi:MAG TPA: YkgJ family cysteine cluster protein [Syntrophales bacterium]|nr:YkgJ family cysteine cluster protein [Syntrophales bacterium]